MIPIPVHVQKGVEAKHNNYRNKKFQPKFDINLCTMIIITMTAIIHRVSGCYNKWYNTEKDNKYIYCATDCSSVGVFKVVGSSSAGLSCSNASSFSLISV